MPVISDGLQPVESSLHRQMTGGSPKVRPNRYHRKRAPNPPQGDNSCMIR